MSNRGRNRTIQLIVMEVSVDFTEHPLLSSAHQQEQRDSANDRIVIDTHKILSAANCPIEVGIVPISWLLKRYLSILQITHCCHQHTNTNRETARQFVIVTDKNCSAVICPIEFGIVPFSWLLLSCLSISQSTQCCYQHTNTNR